jgi:hypothetical protein
MIFERTLLNFGAIPVSQQWKMTKAKKLYVTEFNECEVCGYQKGLEVHHVKPVHLFPDLSCEPTNFITLCDGISNNMCHRKYGHFYDFRNKFNPLIREYAIFSRLFLAKGGVKFVIPTDQLIDRYCKIQAVSRDEFLNNMTNLQGLTFTSMVS